MSNPATIAENRDALLHLRAKGFGQLLDALQDPDCVPARGAGAGRVSVTAVARQLGMSRRAVNKMLAEAREALQ